MAKSNDNNMTWAAFAMRPGWLNMWKRIRLSSVHSNPNGALGCYWLCGDGPWCPEKHGKRGWAHQ